jgi:uncharacterized protein (UPF0261 family)
LIAASLKISLSQVFFGSATIASIVRDFQSPIRPGATLDMSATPQSAVKRVYVVGTCDTKQRELEYVRSLIAAAGVPVVLLDVGTRESGIADVSASEIASHHKRGPAAVLGLDDRGAAVAAMGEALVAYLATRDDVGGVIGLGGSGNTAIVTQGMRSLQVGIPKLMVSTIASGNVAPYVGPCDICMMYSITDVAGINSINRVVLGNAAHAIAGMAKSEIPRIEGGKKQIGLTQFGVTTACVDQVRTSLERDYECMVFHATGIGGQSMEKLIDGGYLVGAIDITTTEVADFLVGGVLPCTEERFGAVARTQIPYVASCGALDMVNFGGIDSVPEKFRDRRLYKHNPQVTLMRTTPEENKLFGEWIATRLNDCGGPVCLLIPEHGVSAIDAPGKPFHDPEADQALFAALEATLKPTPRRRLVRLPLHINDKAFADALAQAFREIAG